MSQRRIHSIYSYLLDVFQKGGVIASDSSRTDTI